MIIALISENIFDINTFFIDLEDLKVALENERNRLQNQIRDLEKDQLQTEHKVQSIQEELQRSHAASAQQQAEEKDLQARLLNEVEERERSHQEVHQLRKQVCVVIEQILVLNHCLYTGCANSAASVESS